MLEKYIPKRFANAMIKHVIAVSLFIPYFTSQDGNYYYQNFILANFFAVLCMIFICTSWKLDFKRNSIFVGGLSILLIAYNVFATYMNYNYHHWYGEQINTTIAFLFFIVLLLVKDPHALIDTATIKATIHMIVASNVLAIVFRTITKYNRLIFMDKGMYLETYSANISQQFAWIYNHKSVYGLMLVLCVAFFVVYRKQFRNILTYILSLGVLFVALYLSDSYTAMGAALLIFVGQFWDYLWKAKWWKKLIITLAISLPLFVITQKLFIQVSSYRNIMTLGSRIPIWNTFTELIRQNPYGMDIIFSNAKFHVPHTVWTNNCHNVFLNHMFRFSIPVGGIFGGIFILIMLFAIKRNFSIQTIFIWIALFIPMTMDYALSTIETSLFFLFIFLMFFCTENKRLTSGYT